MPKRRGYLYEEMCDKKCIERIIKFAARGKHNRHDVRKVLKNLDKYVDKLYDILINETYIPQIPRTKVIWDTSSLKERELEYVKFFPDGIIQVLIVDVMKPELTRGMYKYCCASVPKRGGRAAREYVQKKIKNDKENTKYVGKFDLHHYFHSVDINILMTQLARKIKDKKFLNLIYSILNTCKKGLGIGYYLSQWLSNYYLEWLDRFILNQPGIKYYVRYLDDIVIMGLNKELLHKARYNISLYINKNLKLDLKENWQIFPLEKRFIDFVGYKFYKNYTTLRRKNFLKYARQCRKIYNRIKQERPISFHMAAGLLSKAGQLKHCNGFKAYMYYFYHVGEERLKFIVRHWISRRKQLKIDTMYHTNLLKGVLA